MTRLLDIAIEAAVQLPAEQQDELARTMIAILNKASVQPYELSADERDAVETSREYAARGEFASEEEVEAVLSRFR